LVDASLFLSPLLSGIILGSLYALMAMGLTLIYSTIRVLNFAHGAFFMAGAYIVWWLNTPASALYGTSLPTSGLSLPLAVAVVPAVLIIFGLGAGTQRAVIRPLLKRPSPLITTLVATLALATILESVATLIFGGGRLQFANEIASGVNRFGGQSGLIITNAQLVQLAVAVGVLVGLQVFLKRSRYGIGMRAVAQDLDAANLAGINTETVYMIAFGVGSLLAALAGFLLTNIVFLSPSVGWTPLTIAFIVVVFGGIGSVQGTILASYIIAITQQYVSLFLDTSWGLSFAFLLMMLVLVLRPRGLFGFKEA
jgi:branched-chain amino acid transport system permease protein